MQQFPKGTTSATMPFIISEPRTVFSVQPTGPPSSPPPTFPLPPLPEIASITTSGTTSPVTSIVRSGRPIRPPRPQSSLSDLKPRTIRSPEIAERKRKSELAAKVRFSPIPHAYIDDQPRKAASPQTHKRLTSIRLLTPTHESKSSFSEDVLSSIPKIFQRSPITSPTKNEYSCSLGTEDRKSWQDYQQSPTRSSRRSQCSSPKGSRTVARTALYIPAASSEEGYVQRSVPTLKPYLPSLDTSFGRPMPEAIAEELPAHKRSNAVTAFTFNVGRLAASPYDGYDSTSSEQLTSLPPIPSTLDLREYYGPKCHFERQDKKDNRANRLSAEEITFMSVPYSHTLHTAGHLPRTEKDIETSDDEITTAPTSATRDFFPPRSTSLRYKPAQIDLEVVGDEILPELSEQDKRKASKKKWLWVIATVALVLLATAGILCGIIWKLKGLAG